MTQRHDASDIARMLGQRAGSLVPHLLPHGRREGPEWSSRCPWRGDRREGSFKVRIRGERAGLWSDFASGDAGDALDLVARVLHGGDITAALRWARAWLGLGSDALASRPPSPPPPATPEGAPDADVTLRRRKALALFLDGREGIADTPVADYLNARGITLAELGRQPRALRFHPECWCAEAGRAMPAMLAAITDGTGGHLATHRTYLARDTGGIWRKAPLTQAKKVLGSFGGGFIPLWRGASGQPLARAPEGETLVIAEGIETGLSIALVVPELRAIAAVSVGNLARVALPPAVQTVIIAADNDGDNAASAAAVQRAIDRFAGEGRAVRIARSPVGSDFNDAILAGTEA